ncbi:hypothetical protein [Corynebacterium sp. CCUG 70398]|uniref:biotin synthase auxiliary protein BsaP n=1 Tax=Corynebacterium sp. CCUG 70398 TaxID=2823891 RepID=UPI00210CE855|nr:hypothetical protein [Corynebacterium sp. CCUG 70398]MCQ4617746.1 hypothetical protein [Corynebacterium pseudogenitalium]MCQ4622351.1 hypothetical protein [Corynebacterium sp. CCUG 70398]
MKIPDNSELASAVLSGEVSLPADPARPYDAPRICPLCQRRMVVKISPMGWAAACSRHGELRSEWLER